MKEYRGRFLIATIVVVQAFFILIARMWYLQILRGEEFERFSLNNRIRLVRIPAPRGRIFDRKGRELVVNRASFDVYVTPSEVKNIEQLSTSLSNVLGINKDEIKDKIKKASVESRFKPALIARDINRNQLAFLEARKSSLQGLSIEANHVRKYPYGKLGAPFLGYVGKASQKELKLYTDITSNNIVGKSGIERAFDSYLRGEDGFIQKVTDALGREVKNNLFSKESIARNSVPGADIVLSIDLDIQKAAEEALGDRAGAVVVVDVRTGDILALVSHPTFNPADFTNGIDPLKWKELVNDPYHPLLNRATQGIYAPGSVFKIVTAAAGMQEGVITQTTSFYCPGRYKLGRRTFKCWKTQGHGWVNLEKAIVESCDVYFYYVAERLGIDRLAPYIKEFALGVKTGIDIEETSGIAPSEEWKLKLFKKPWYQGETTVTAIGQGYLSVTPLQVAVMTAAVANGGTILKPQLVKRILSPEGESIVEYQPIKIAHLPVSDKVLNTIKEALKGVVNNPNGTGRSAKSDKVVIAGKTGTAQVISLGKGTHERHQDHAWFTAYAPAEAPEIAVTVLVEHGGKGGAVAAPIAKEIIEAYMRLKEGGNV
jgi:penicillin-binding protein 2